MKGRGGINSVVNHFLKRTEMFVIGETCRNGMEDNLFGFCKSVRIQKTLDS